MKNEQCVQFLQWALRRLNMRWPGYRKVRNQVCKRVDRRLQDLSLKSVEEYQAYLEQHADEWLQLDPLCRITISRFYRDKGVFAALGDERLPEEVEGLYVDLHRRILTPRLSISNLTKSHNVRW